MSERAHHMATPIVTSETIDPDDLIALGLLALFTREEEAVAFMAEVFAEYDPEGWPHVIAGDLPPEEETQHGKG